METLSDFTKLLSPEQLAVLNKPVEQQDFGKSESLQGYNFIPGFSSKAAEYAYNNWDFKKGDIFLVSYPKTGSHWAGEIILRLLHHNQPEMEKLDKELPALLRFIELGDSKKFELIDKLPFARRGFASHLPAQLFNIEKAKAANAKVVYLLRNPKDQIVSWLKFAQALPISKEEPIKSMVNSGWNNYFEHVVSGEFPMMSKPGEWYPDHILSWYKHKESKNVYFIFYEDLKKDVVFEIGKLAKFLEIAISEEICKAIADACDFDNMKKSLSDDSKRSEDLKINLRKGRVGGWKDYFTVSQSERVDDIMKEKLKGTDIKFIYNL